MKKHETFANNPAIKIYVNKTAKKIIFKIRAAYFLKILLPETMKLLLSTENKTTKDKNSENISHC